MPTEPDGQNPPLSTAPVTTGGRAGTDQLAAEAAAQAQQLGDDASRSLADALRISFKVLRVLIFALILLFIFSGFFYVQANEVAVRLRFGAITDNGQGRDFLTADGGPYFRFPAPIDEVIRVPTTSQTIEVDRAFWYEADSRNPDEPNPRTRQTLSPGRDGSLLTGDGNLVHGRFTITFRVQPQDAVTFVRNVGGDADGEFLGDPMRRARQVVMVAAEQAITAAAAEVTALEFLQSAQYTARMRQKLVSLLTDEMETGITVESVIANNRVAPPAAQAAFSAVTTAETERQTQVLNAEQDRVSRLSGVAGEGYEPLLAAIDLYNDAGRDDQQELEAAALSAINMMLDGTPSGEALEPVVALIEDEQRRAALAPFVDPQNPLSGVTVGGEAAQLIAAAGEYRAQREEQVEADVQQFEALLATYRQQPEITRFNLWQNMREQIFTNDREIWFFDGELARLAIPRDSGIDKRRTAAQAERDAAEARRRAALSPSARPETMMPQ